MPRLLAITQSTFDPASRFRLMQFLPHFAAAGWHVTHRPLRPSLYRQPCFISGRLHQWEERVVRTLRKCNSLRSFAQTTHYDAVLVSREVPHFHRFLVQRTNRLIFDFDDAIYLGSAKPVVAELCAAAVTVVVGNETLAQAARQWSSQVEVIPTVVNPYQYHFKPGVSLQKTIRVGWLGSPFSIRETLGPYMSMLAEFQRELGFEFVIISSRPETVPPSELHWQFVEWSPTRETEIAEFLDIGIMPLVDTPLQQAKCGAKLLQYMAAGLPAIASPIGVSQQIVVPGETGLLASNRQEWRAALLSLITHPEQRQRIGEAARRRVIAEYSLDRWLPHWLSLLTRAAGFAPQPR
jgi:glycosyltransferase involved in cell wall biosynthesis